MPKFRHSLIGVVVDVDKDTATKISRAFEPVEADKPKTEPKAKKSDK